MSFSYFRHQSAADAGDLRRIQRQILHLCHLDRHRLEVRQPAVAAKTASAATDTAQHFGLIAHADLSELDAHFEYTCQILDQFAEVYTSVCCKVKDDLALIEGVFHIDQLHHKSMLIDFFLAERHRLFLLLDIFLMLSVILLAGHSDNSFERRNDIVLVDCRCFHRHRPEFHTARGLHDDIGTDLQF